MSSFVSNGLFLFLHFAPSWRLSAAPHCCILHPALLHGYPQEKLQVGQSGKKRDRERERPDHRQGRETRKRKVPSVPCIHVRIGWGPGFYLLLFTVKLIAIPKLSPCSLSTGLELPAACYLPALYCYNHLFFKTQRGLNRVEFSKRVPFLAETDNYHPLF